jgi:hypothetical protein
VEKALAAFPGVLRSNRGRSPLELALFLSEIRDGCAIAIRGHQELSAAYSFGHHEFLLLSGETEGKQKRVVAAGMILRQTLN